MFAFSDPACRRCCRSPNVLFMDGMCSANTNKIICSPRNGGETLFNLIFTTMFNDMALYSARISVESRTSSGSLHEHLNFFHKIVLYVDLNIFLYSNCSLNSILCLPMQYISRIMYTVCAVLLCYKLRLYPYPSGWLHWCKGISQGFHRVLASQITGNSIVCYKCCPAWQLTCGFLSRRSRIVESVFKS